MVGGRTISDVLVFDSIRRRIRLHPFLSAHSAVVGPHDLMMGLSSALLGTILRLISMHFSAFSASFNAV